MRRRCFPLRGDHTLLAPDALMTSDVRSQQQEQPDVVVLSERLRNFNTFGSVAGSTRQHVVSSTNRHLRFEDETEREAETRYLERWSQRRQEMQQRPGVLVSRPDLQYMKATAALEQRQLKSTAVGKLRGQTVMRDLGRIHPGERESGGGVILNLSHNEHPPVIEERERSLNRKQLRLRTEPLRETYIGFVAPSNTGRKGEKSCHKSCAQVRQSQRNQQFVSQSPLTTDPPTGSESFCSEAPPLQQSVLCSLSFKHPFSLSSSSIMSVMPQRNTANLRKQGKDLDHNQERQGPPSNQRVHRQLRSGPERTEKVPYLVNPPSRTSSSATSLEMKGCNQTPPAVAIRDGSAGKSLRSEFHTEDASPSEQLSRSRTRSLDRLPSKSQPPANGQTSLGSLRSCSFLKTCPSVRCCCEGSNIFPLTKFSSVFNVWSEQNCSTDGSADDH
ncbi:uncharacterized protein LOC110015039 isoform X2 [Oryzias latipes]|uniref:uncharacterized protein LOC110015039 isoform X2 n=1 Tax=Oryzias latipes TaxID=8090 RepID=UPI0009D9492B|nr:uncharacterized protein LOC110015039 isoform X2 [Oryzias latipes]